MVLKLIVAWNNIISKLGRYDMRSGEGKEKKNTDASVKVRLMFESLSFLEIQNVNTTCGVFVLFFFFFAVNYSNRRNRNRVRLFCALFRGDVCW